MKMDTTAEYYWLVVMFCKDGPACDSVPDDNGPRQIAWMREKYVPDLMDQLRDGSIRYGSMPKVFLIGLLTVEERDQHEDFINGAGPVSIQEVVNKWVEMEKAGRLVVTAIAEAHFFDSRAGRRLL
jgi:hypothetical protein